VKANGGAVLPFLHIISTKNKKGKSKIPVQRTISSSNDCTN
jgi:hypothetical protein